MPPNFPGRQQSSPVTNIEETTVVIQKGKEKKKKGKTMARINHPEKNGAGGFKEMQQRRRENNRGDRKTGPALRVQNTGKKKKNTAHINRLVVLVLVL